MKKTAMMSTAAALMLVTPAMAHSGYVDLSYTNNDIGIVGPDPSVDGYRVGGEAVFDLGGLGAQLGGGIADVDSSGADATIWGVDGHLFHRSGQWLFGGTLGYREANFDPGGDASTWLTALQAHYEMECTTLIGALSYSGFEAGIDQGNVVGVDGQIRFFANDNLRFDGTLGWRDIDFDGGGDSSDWHGGVGGEWQFATWPVSIFAGYMHSDNGDADFTQDIVTIGVRWNWGGSLRNRDRAGATMLRPGDGLTANGI